MELIIPTTATVLASYDHPVWGKYAAITQNKYGKGFATYIGCFTKPALTEKIVADVLRKAGLWSETQKLAFPVITKDGVNENGKTIRYIFNYSAKPKTITYPFATGKELLQDKAVRRNNSLLLAPWDVKIIEEQ